MKHSTSLCDTYRYVAYRENQIKERDTKNKMRAITDISSTPSLIIYMLAKLHGEGSCIAHYDS